MTKFRIEFVGSPPGFARLISTEKLTPSDFDEVAMRLGVKPFRARKIGFVAALQATTRTRIETRWNGKESEITAVPGDWIVANMTPDRQLMRDSEGHLNVYAITAARFPELYARDEGSTPEGKIYRAISDVEAIFVPGGFAIMAPWGEKQQAGEGYLIKNGHDIYGNAKTAFVSTYTNESQISSGT